MRYRLATLDALHAAAGHLSAGLQRIHHVVMLPAILRVGAVCSHAKKETLTAVMVATALWRQLHSFAQSFCDKELLPAAQSIGTTCLRMARFARMSTSRLVDCLHQANTTLTLMVHGAFSRCWRWWNSRPLARRIMGAASDACTSAWQGVVVHHLWPCISTCVRLARTTAQSVLGNSWWCTMACTQSASDRIRGMAVCVREILTFLNMRVSPVVAPAFDRASKRLRMCKAFVHQRCQNLGEQRRVARPTFQMARNRRFDHRHAVM